MCARSQCQYMERSDGYRCMSLERKLAPSPMTLSRRGLAITTSENLYQTRNFSGLVHSVPSGQTGNLANDGEQLYDLSR
jgi:hypothetical protein